ncbi:MAG TPA: hypothetical protein PLL26_03570 [Candidatus Dojkabacteria bacterium]|nr:hypothetical protein [Candidatus Dojkabacteria bacterium]
MVRDIYIDDEIKDGSIIEIEGKRYTFSMDGRYVKLAEKKGFLDGLKKGSYLYCIIPLIGLSGIVIIIWVIRNKNKPE